VPATVRSHADACPGVFAPHDAADGALARIRLPGGLIGAAALRVVADAAAELGDGQVHLTSRGNLQLRGLTRCPDLAARLSAAGLLPSATHERVRNVLASPLSGIAGGRTDVRGVASALDRALCARPGLAALPGRFLFALDDGRGDVADEDPDLCWLAGSLLVADAETGLRVDAENAVDALLDAAEAFLALRATEGGTAWRAAELADAPTRIAVALDGGRGARGHRSLQQGGLAAMGLEQGHLAAIPATPAAATPGPVRRDDGGIALVVAPVLGELTADQVRLLAEAAPDVVVTPWRTVVLPDPLLPAEQLAAAGLVVAPGPAAGVSACAGRPGCAKALADVRADARDALERLPDGRRIHVSGCERRCGAPRTEHVDAVALAGGGYLVDGVRRPELAR
jgi:precorrin-3B synthase